MFDSGKEVAPFEAPEIDPHISSSAPHGPSTSRTSPPTISLRPAPRAVLGVWSRARSCILTDMRYATDGDRPGKTTSSRLRSSRRHKLHAPHRHQHHIKNTVSSPATRWRPPLSPHGSYNIIVVFTNEEGHRGGSNRVVELGGRHRWCAARARPHGGARRGPAPDRGHRGASRS